MSLAAPEDAASVLEQFVHDVANTPAEITFLLEEIQAKDMQIQAFRDEINKRDNQLQKWVRVNGGHVQNPKEEAFSKTINDCYDKCEVLQAEKNGLSERMAIVLDRQIKRLDVGLRGLAAREEFPSDWGGPTLLTGSGNVTGVNTPATGGGGAVHAAGPLQAVSGNAGPGGEPNIANAARMRMAQQAAQAGRGVSGSGAQTPTNTSRTQREGSADAAKRRRLNASLGVCQRRVVISANLPLALERLRQAPRSNRWWLFESRLCPTSATYSSTEERQLADSTDSTKTCSSGGTSNRKRDRNRGPKKSDRRRALKSDRATPSTNASLSDEDEDSGASPTPSSVPRTDGASDRRRGAPAPVSSDDDDEEGEEDNSFTASASVRLLGR